MEKDTSEIEQLTERIAKDPKSKLFVPLAEEYKKTGDIEMAIQVLTDGLKANPGYVTARSFLGRLLLDKGDLAGAQKELEEVIKAIPDNLLAQRKLGDLYVLQGKGRDAVQRYKAALFLNPADKELPSLLADLEAGKDVSARIPRPKAAITPAAPQSSPASAAQIQTKASPATTVKPAVSAVVQPAATQKTVPAAPAASKADAVPPASAASKPEAAPVAQKTEHAPVAQPSPVPPTPTTHDEVEVIEDIFEIEHLENPVAAPEVRADAFELPAEPIREPASSAADAFKAPAFDLNETSAKASSDTGDQPDASWGDDAFTVLPAVTTEQQSAVSDDGGDDLNTNTLAELYISQGFYDKAIEIYQGMLGEHPDNKALQQKLEKLRTLAVAAGMGVEKNATAEPAAGEYSPPAPAVLEEPQPHIEAPVVTSAEAPGPLQGTTQFQEQTPVEAALEKVVREAAPDGGVTRGPKAARRKETIDRLESWLTNLMKEKK